MYAEEYDLFFGGGYSIKEYYMESGNPRQMRGASELLKECVNEVIDLLIKNGVKIEHIISGGATLSAKVPSRKSADIVKNAELIFLNNCRTANAAFVAVPFDADYLEVKKHALAEYESRRMAKFIPWEFQDSEAGDIHADYQLIRTNGRPFRPDIPVRCPRCRLRTPRYEVKKNSEISYLCTSCAKRENKSNERRLDLQKKHVHQFDYSNTINMMSDLSDGDGRVALLYADINNLGGRKFSEFDEDRMFHKKVEKSLEQTVYAAIYNAIRTTLNVEEGKVVPARFEVIALGGDDVCLLLPGNAALLAAKSIQQDFKVDSYPLTISVAACVANDTTPVTYMEKVVNNALEKAKQHAYSKEQSAVCLSFFEKIGPLFPMTESEMDNFYNFLQQTSDIALTALRGIAEARREMESDEEFSLFLDYYLSRDAIRGNVDLLTEIRNQYRNKNPWWDLITWRARPKRDCGNEV